MTGAERADTRWGEQNDWGGEGGHTRGRTNDCGGESARENEEGRTNTSGGEGACKNDG